MNVTLMHDVQTLSEVVVTGMQKMDKRLFTGATKQLSADEVKLDGLHDISRGLEGRACRRICPKCFRHIWYRPKNPGTWCYIYFR